MVDLEAIGLYVVLLLFPIVVSLMVDVPRRYKIALFLYFLIFAIAGISAEVWKALKPEIEDEPIRESEPSAKLDLTQEAMRACAEAFVRYGFYDVRDYECRIEVKDGGVAVVLYGPDESGGLKRYGEVPIGK